MSIIITTQTRTNIISINIGINNSKILQYSILSNLLEKRSTRFFVQSTNSLAISVKRS